MRIETLNICKVLQQYNIYLDYNVNKLQYLLNQIENMNQFDLEGYDFDVYYCLNLTKQTNISIKTK